MENCVMNMFISQYHRILDFAPVPVPYGFLPPITFSSSHELKHCSILSQFIFLSVKLCFVLHPPGTTPLQQVASVTGTKLTVCL